jgi:hypothetical protein
MNALSITSVRDLRLIPGVAIEPSETFRELRTSGNGWCAIFKSSDVSSYSRGALAAVNPFLLLAIFLHAKALQYVAKLTRSGSYAISTVLAFIEIGANSLLSGLFI